MSSNGAGIEPKTGKRIVSKGAYASSVSRKLSLALFGRGTLALGGFGLSLAIILAIASLYFSIVIQDGFFLCLAIFLFFGVGSGSIMLLRYGKKAVEDALLMQTGVPLTRANTADLPALDSLVRASSEPLQAQEAVLLRAAAHGQETPPEQLVRASVGME